MQKIPLSKCFVNEEIRSAALRALDSGQYILGKECKAFEEELARHTGTQQCVLGSSWTMIVYMLHKAMELKPGDEVIVPSHTAFPTMEPLIHCGATPVFVDVDDTYCLDVKQVEAAVTPRTVGIIPVHLYGHPANLDAIFPIAEKNKLWVLEDCAQAQGAKYKGKTVGSMGLMGAFSFYPSKNLTVLGDGGCLCTNDAALAEKVRMLRNHGRKDKYLHEMAGFNVRFNEIQGAVGRVGLRNLDQLNDHRRQVAARYNERLKGVAVTPAEKDYARHVYHMYVIRVEKRDELAKFLKEKNIETGVHYPVPNHQQPGVTSKFKNLPKLPVTEKIVNEILSLPIYGELPMSDVDRVCDAIIEFCKLNV